MSADLMVKCFRSTKKRSLVEIKKYPKEKERSNILNNVYVNDIYVAANYSCPVNERVY